VFSSPALLGVLSVVFAVTGLYSLVRLSTLASGANPGVDRVAELSHLLMSIAMIGMTWGWTGGPGTGSGVLQLGVFGLLGLWFLARVLRPDGHWLGTAYHLVVQVAMVWMVAAMPTLMGMGGGSTSAPSGHEGHGSSGALPGMGEMDGMGHADPAPLWTQVVTLAFVVLLAGAAMAWAAAAVRPAVRPAPVPVAAGAAGPPACDPAPVRTTDRRLAAGCHLLMSLGMAVMLLAML
jgi:hypothetical protein